VLYFKEKSASPDSGHRLVRRPSGPCIAKKNSALNRGVLYDLAVQVLVVNVFQANARFPVYGMEI
jgi:hypothetical protein